MVASPRNSIDTSASSPIREAVRHERKGIGAESYPEHVEIAHRRIGQELNGALRTRPMGKAIYDPTQASNPLVKPPEKKLANNAKITEHGTLKYKFLLSEIMQ